ncbi:hypothetical protein A7X67_11150 [Clostridium sp. W14A]|nr:hypothetical protein A7X67_11150 [Clostridium sp. W14A]
MTKKKNPVLLFLAQFILIFALLNILLAFVSYKLKIQTDLKVVEGVSAGVSLVLCVMNFRPKKRSEYKDIEHGSARWGKRKEIAPYIDPVFRNNIILSCREFLSMNMWKTRRDCHVFVVGGSGSGKSKFYAKPNVMQMNASYVITDPSGEHMRDEGKMLEDHGYKVKVFNVVDMEDSLHFNPFHYYKEPEDIIRFVELFIANTNGGTSQNSSGDMGFWNNCEKLWFMAHIAYVMETCLEEEKNMNSVVLLLNNSEAREDDESYKSAVDILFDELEQKNPDSFAVKQYKKYKLAAGVVCSKRLIYHDFCHG